MTVQRPDFQRRRTRRPHGRFNGRRKPSSGLGATMLLAAIFVSLAAFLGSGGRIGGGPSTGSTSEVRYYPNCDAARAAGVAPINEGEPGYRPELDADGDGIACEPYRGF